MLAIMPKRYRRALHWLLLSLSLSLVLSARHALSQPLAPAAAPTPLPKTVPSDPSRDLALKTYMQKHFRLASLDWIHLGPMTETALPGIFAREITVTNDKGQTAHVTMYSDRQETKLIVGQLVDLASDPWGRTDLRPLHLEDRPTLGPSDAPVTMIEFADFECPYCAHAFNQVETLVNTTYKGKVRLIFKNYPLAAHPWAKTAAVAAECARLQNPDAFWEFARHFYTNQGSINPGNVKQDSDQLAAKLKLDPKLFDACMAGTTAPKRIAEDTADGSAVHVNSTPTFYINGIPLVGLPEDSVFAMVINAELGGNKQASK